MSHFVVAVITENGTEEEVAHQLQPFHEYECTGTEDEFVVWVDETEEVKNEWNKEVECWADAEGNLFDGWEDCFFREPTEEESAKELSGSGFGNGISWRSADWGDGLGYRPKVKKSDEQMAEDGFVKKSVPQKDTGKYESIEEFAEKWFGYEKRDGQFGRLTNPNKKWDWWVIGGRWQNRLLDKAGLRGNTMMISELDIEGAIADATKDCSAAWHRVHEIIDRHPDFIQWSAMVEKHEGDIGKARDEYWEQPCAKELSKSDPFMEQSIKEMGHDEYCKATAIRSVASMAFVRDRKWSERAEMGWFGVEHSQNDDYDFVALLNDCNPDHYITMVDCHI